MALPQGVLLALPLPLLLCLACATAGFGPPGKTPPLLARHFCTTKFDQTYAGGSPSPIPTLTHRWVQDGNVCLARVVGAVWLARLLWHSPDAHAHAHAHAHRHHFCRMPTWHECGAHRCHCRREHFILPYSS